MYKISQTRQCEFHGRKATSISPDLLWWVLTSWYSSDTVLHKCKIINFKNFNHSKLLIFSVYIYFIYSSLTCPATFYNLILICIDLVIYYFYFWEGKRVKPLINNNFNLHRFSHLLLKAWLMLLQLFFQILPQ
jgi:hypothetical protein